VKSVLNLSFPQFHHKIGDAINFNCCGDIDYGNCAVAPDFMRQILLWAKVEANTLSHATKMPKQS
tara:strand:+ start:45654 stop:45848 length:195 start_codon:yes stop_codon:yes gene_type:complete